jgi:hypothetical protein
MQCTSGPFGASKLSEINGSFKCFGISLMGATVLKESSDGTSEECSEPSNPQQFAMINVLRAPRRPGLQAGTPVCRASVESGGTTVLTAACLHAHGRHQGHMKRGSYEGPCSYLSYPSCQLMRMNGNVVALGNRAEEQQTLRRLRRMKTVSVFT